MLLTTLPEREVAALLRKANALESVAANRREFAAVCQDVESARRGGDAMSIGTSMPGAAALAVLLPVGREREPMTRESNEYAARLAQDHPGWFGSYAMLPMHDTDGALRELEYALDVLKANGIGLMTSYGDKWLGHASHAPVLDELNRRKAILYAHPTAANCCRGTPSSFPCVRPFQLASSILRRRQLAAAPTLPANHTGPKVQRAGARFGVRSSSEGTRENTRRKEDSGITARCDQTRPALWRRPRLRALPP